MNIIWQKLPKYVPLNIIYFLELQSQKERIWIPNTSSCVKPILHRMRFNSLR